MSSDKGRQTSSGKPSFFSRVKHKSDKRNTSDEGRFLGPLDMDASGSVAARTSRHHNRESSINNRDSIISVDRPGSPESGLNMMAGVMTSIPYDSVSPDHRSPVTTEYASSIDGGYTGRREPLPHQLNKATSDYHQYPSFDPASSSATAAAAVAMSMYSAAPGAHLSAGRLAPGTNNLTMASTGRQTQLQQWGPPRESSYQTTSHNSRYNSYAPSVGRTSTDQASIMSALPSASSQSSYASYRDLNRTAKTSNSATVTTADGGFALAKPDDDVVIEQMFVSLMQKRGWHNLPEQARRQMIAYPPTKKWTLIYQDRLTEWQGEQRRRQSSRPGQYQNVDITTFSDEEGSPEWYVRKVMENSLDSKHLGSLEVNLRTQQIGWVKRFIECQGQVALTNVLLKINRKSARGPTVPDSGKGDKDVEREYDIVKCLKALMNNKYGADDALAHQQVLVALCMSLISPRLSTRKLVSEVLTFLSHWGSGEGHMKVIQAMDSVKSQQGENGRFDAWMRIIEVTVDGRGKMGSLVGASEEVRSGGIGMENLLMEYAVATLILINMLVDAPERDLQLRLHIRAQFTACGIKRVLAKMEAFQYDLIDKQIERFRSNEAIDYEDMLERDNSSIKDSIEGEVKDLNDPVQIVDAIQQRLKGSKTQDYFVSALQHLLLIRDNDGEERLRLFQLVDSMVSYVAMDRRLPDMDLKQSLNFTVQNLLDKLHTDSEARQALDEALEGRQIAEAAMAERDEMKARLELGADGLVAKMQKQLDEQTRFIEAQRRQADALKAEIESVQTLRAKEAQRNELETRELYLMLRDAQDVAASTAAATKAAAGGAAGGGAGGKLGDVDPVRMQGILDRERLMERLRMQIERQKTQYKLEGRVWGDAVGPSDRLRALREEMEGYSGAGDSEGRGVEGLLGVGEGGLSPMSVLGSVSRISRRPVGRGGQQQQQQHQNGGLGGSGGDESEAGGEGGEEGGVSEGGEGDDVVYEKPRMVSIRRPVIDPKQQNGLISEIAGKVRRYDGSDSEDGDGPTFGSVTSVGLPVVRPKRKLKALHWEKVDETVTTHWAAHTPSAEEREEKYLELSRKGILDEVEKLFMAKETKKIGGGSGKKDDKKQIISTDVRKAYEIAFAKFSQLSVDRVVQLIIHCDKEVLDNSVVMEFLQKDDLCNIPDNVSKLLAPYGKDWTGPRTEEDTREADPAELTRQDQIFLLTAYELHHYWKGRMRALALTRSFEADYDEIMGKIGQVVAVSESIRDSVSLMNVLGLILDIGNYMNDANKQARGFKLSSLARLGMVKDDKNESTLADMVERIVRQQYPEWEAFATDIGGVLTAQKINIEQLQADAKKYVININSVQRSFDSGNLSDPKRFHPQDRVAQVVLPVMKEARRKAEQMELYLEEMVRTYDDIMAFYGEDSRDENARRDFFAKLALFIQEWKKSHEKNVQYEETRRRNEASMKRKHAAQLKANGGVGGAGDPMIPLPSPTSAGAMDSLLEKLRAAAPQTRDQRDRRRRARLKDRHQVRIASGQKVADPNESGDGEAGRPGSASGGGSGGAAAGIERRSSLSTTGGGSESQAAGLLGSGSGSSALTPIPASPSEGDANDNGDGGDVAARAALMLQGMRGDEADEEKRESQRKMRRQTAEEERRSRRRRRERAQSGTIVGGVPSLAESDAGGGSDVAPTTPTTPATPADEGVSDTVRVSVSTIPSTVKELPEVPEARETETEEATAEAQATEE
ncbi:cytokinesis protein bni1 [Grosmannia clavigera kw1407]|uniref:Cytokinesis protein bni1 n=1 Tax=Grosmannia clavigera (strain kw1407 / UAMH 11150) TaxID=655863 RepID=F0XCZ9_GROCL|nr:cytokinesis protein bni1 [Grosmannia clavigera kw1407]EFX03652.1 cytokinesis protein bni1 [Grosmannia clavigera kw1407]